MLNLSGRLFIRWDRMLPPVTDPDACRPWSGRLDNKGYGFIKVNGITTRVHRVAWAMENGGWPPPDKVVRHTCDNPPCCNERHLVLGTVKQNVGDCIARGRRARGEETGGAVLTADAVRDIRERVRAGARQWEVAADFGVTQACVSSVVRRRTWAHVPDVAKVAWPVDA